MKEHVEVELTPGFVPGGVPDPVDCHPVQQARNPLEVRADILQMQEAMAPLPQVECPLKHHFAPGMYVREIFIPRGTVVVGKIHRHAHVNIISKGTGKVVTEFGEFEYEAPYTFVSQPGTKRALVTLSDTIWTTIHANPEDETDLEALESKIISPDYASIGLENTPAQTISIEVKQ